MSLEPTIYGEMDILENPQTFNPLDEIESLAASQPWLCERIRDEELQLHLSGEWCDYDLALSWWPDLACLHIICLFGVQVKDGQRRPILDLIAQVNAELRLGHFGLYSVSSEEASDRSCHIIFRHTHLLAHLLGGEDVVSAQCKILIEASIAAAEKYVLSFQCVAHQGRSVMDAILLASLSDGGRA